MYLIIVYIIYMYFALRMGQQKRVGQVRYWKEGLRTY